MSSTHRRKIARALAKATGMTYQQALAAVIAAAADDRLPHALDDTGITAAVDLLAAHHGAQPPVVSPHHTADTIDPLASFAASRQDRDRLASLLATRHGLIVIAGSTGAGKTTALYDMMIRLAETGKQVTSVETLIERHLAHPNITQRLVERDRHSAGVEIAAAVHQVRRSEPDVLVVGDEILYPEVTHAIVNAAMTGMLVLASVHATTPEAVVQRLRGLVSPALLAETLSGIVNLTYSSLGRRAEVTPVTDQMRDQIHRRVDSRPLSSLTHGDSGSGRGNGPAETTVAAGVFVGVTERPAAASHLPADPADRECATIATGPASAAHFATHRIGHTFVTPAAGHLLVTGNTGAGKTVIAREAMCLHRSRGDRVVLIDTIKHGAEYDGFADEVATAEAEIVDLINRLHKGDRRTLLVVEEIGDATDLASEANTLLFNVFGIATPDRLRIVATTQRPLIFNRDRTGDPLGWPSGFDTNVVLGPNATLDRALRTTAPHAPLRRGWAYVEHPDGRLETVNLHGEEKDKPFSENDREQVRTGLRRLAAMMCTGIQPSPALSTLAQTMTGEAQRVFLRLADASMLSTGASREPHVFEPWTVVMLQNGETGGAIWEAVKAIVDVY